MSTITKISHIFNRQIKIKLILLLVAIIAGSLLETAALSVISPFISVVLDASVIQSNSVLHYVFNFLGFKSDAAFLAFLAFSVAFIYIVRGVYMFALSKVQYRFLSKRQIELSNRLLKIVLEKSYLYHTNKNLAELQRIIITDVKEFINLVTSILLLASDLFMSSFIFIFLLITSVPMTLGVMGLALICVAVYFKALRKKIRAAGDENRSKHVQMTKSVIQALGGIKELKVMRREKYFINQFRQSSDDYVKVNQRYNVYNSIPKLLIEAVCFSGAFTLMGIFIYAGVNMENIVPQLSLFVLAAFRLLPAVSRFTNYVNGITFYRSSVNAIYAGLFESGNIDNAVSEDKKTEPSSDIVADSLTFQYPNTNTPVLENISLRVPHKKSAAFIGPTGAGKTTLADIILGVYTPQSGTVFYNGKSVHHNLDEWTKHIGYIPQQIYLLDETILENVAFGIPKSKIDGDKVWEVLEKAQIKNFVEALPEQLDTVVGDRGIRLSGGQRQRIGIARALYNNPDILVLDEATSSLDNETEKAVMEAIANFRGEKTMIIIAHRLSTIEHCDVIYRIENGNVCLEKEKQQ